MHRFPGPPPQSSHYSPIKDFGLRKEFGIPRPICAGPEFLPWLRNDYNVKQTSLLTEGKERSRACGISNSCLGRTQTNKKNNIMPLFGGGTGG